MRFFSYFSASDDLARHRLKALPEMDQIQNSGFQQRPAAFFDSKTAAGSIL
jgi:hypothetical protein